MRKISLQPKQTSLWNEIRKSFSSPVSVINCYYAPHYGSYRYTALTSSGAVVDITPRDVADMCGGFVPDPDTEIRFDNSYIMYSDSNGAYGYTPPEYTDRFVDGSSVPNRLDLEAQQIKKQQEEIIRQKGIIDYLEEDIAKEMLKDIERATRVRKKDAHKKVYWNRVVKRKKK